MHMNVIKSLNQRGQHNWIKILCLAVGLATGIVLIGKAGFEQNTRIIHRPRVLSLTA